MNSDLSPCATFVWTLLARGMCSTRAHLSQAIASDAIAGALTELDAAGLLDKRGSMDGMVYGALIDDRKAA
jgi:hypothetical protein